MIVDSARTPYYLRCSVSSRVTAATGIHEVLLFTVFREPSRSINPAFLLIPRSVKHYYIRWFVEFYCCGVTGPHEPP